MEWLEAYGGSAAHFDCVDPDANAIRYASTLCGHYPGSVRFHHANALTFRLIAQRPTRRWTRIVLSWKASGVHLWKYTPDPLIPQGSAACASSCICRLGSLRRQKCCRCLDAGIS